MRLSEWLQETGLRRKDFAKLAQVSPPMISLIIGGRRLPSAELIERISRVTGGRVSSADWPLRPRKSPVRKPAESATPIP